jgi:hypothetical protein
MNALSDDAGLVGKLLIFWLLVLAIFVLASIDTVSVVITRFHTADIAGGAAGDAAANYRQSKSTTQACQVAIGSIRAADPQVKLAPHGCKITASTGVASITVYKKATTLIAGRLSFTKKWTTVTDTESVAPPTV